MPDRGLLKPGWHGFVVNGVASKQTRKPSTFAALVFTMKQNPKRFVGALDLPKIGHRGMKRAQAS